MSRQRFYLDVPNPRAWFVLGQPDDRGYRGVSLGADDHLFVSVKGQAFHQAKGPVQHVTLSGWYQASAGDSVVNSGANALYTSKKQVIVVAGAGYAPDVQLELGDSPPAGYFNPLDYQEIMNPCRDGVRAYDTAFTPKDKFFRSLVGYEQSPGAAAAAEADRAQKIKAAVLAFLFGWPVEPTANSDSIEQFARQAGGLTGMLATLKRVTDTVERWTSRPDTLPLVGPVIGKLNAVKKAVNGLTSTYTQALALLPTVGGPDLLHRTRGKGGLPNDYKQELDEAGNVVSDASGTFDGSSAFDRDWSRKANQAVSVIALPQHLLRPLANRARAVSNALQSLRGAMDSLAELLRVKRKNSALALVGKDGVSIVSPRRVFAYAADGFHFVSANVGPPSGGLLDRAAAAVTALNDWVGQVVPLPPAVPGFTVRSAGPIDMSSEGCVSTSALGPDALMQMMSQGVAEFGAVDSAALTARRGTAEVLGKKVVLGSTAKRAKAMAIKAATVAMATAAMQTASTAMASLRKQYRELFLERTRNQTNLKELTDKVLTDPVKYSWELATQIGALSAKVRAAEAPLRALMTGLQAADNTLQEAADLRSRTEGATEAGARSVVAEELGWTASSQSLADSVEIGAAASVEVYSADKVTIEAAGKIELVSESAPPVPTQTMKITMGTEIEIAGGAAGLVHIKVTGTGVTIKTPGTEIKCGGSSLELTAGLSKITVAADGIIIDGPALTLRSTTPIALA